MPAALVQATDGLFFIAYGTGAVEGTTVYDSLQLAAPPITIERQGFGLAEQVSEAFVVASCDGLFVRPLSKSLSLCTGGSVLCHFPLDWAIACDTIV